MKEIPDGWLKFSNWGNVVPGTRFFPFKVPLKETVNVPQDKKHTVASFIASNPNVKLIINLTDTENGRYYNYEDFLMKGIRVIQIRVNGGGQLPHKQLLKTFAETIADFQRTIGRDNPAALIGVHCTHGLNRTGLFICLYMMNVLGMRPEEVLSRFQTARGHDFDRDGYVKCIESEQSFLY